MLIWLGSGFFIVQEGQQAVITQFGRYKPTVGAGFNWRLPYPIQRTRRCIVTQIRSVEVGRDAVVQATGLRDSSMLTEDENIVEIKFAVQYRLKDARAFLFESKNPAEAVVQAAEIGGARDRRQDARWTRCWPRSATRSRRACAS